MRCKTCNYPLWQITARNCPECGAGFVPSDFEFVINSVKFCCPHCQQAYYGTGEKGHLVPRGFACVACGKGVEMDQMVLMPASNVSEQQTEGMSVPWVDRRTRSWVGAFFATFGLGVGNPVGLIEHVPETSTLGRAFTYGALQLMLHFVLGLGWVALFPFAIAMMFGVGGGGPSGYLALAGSFLAALAVPPVALMVWIAAAHGVLRLTGPTAAGMTRTGHAVCYSAGNNFLSGIPCVGFYLSPFAYLWWAISGAFMLRRAQKVSGWRAGLAMSVPGVVVVLGIGGLIAWAVWEDSRRGGAFGVPPPPPPPAAVVGSGFSAPGEAAAYLAITLEGLDGQGALDAHAGRLLIDGDLDPEDMLLPGTRSTTGNCTISGIPLRMFVPARETLRPTVDALGTPGQHRVGDFVFVCQGIDPKTADERLWLAIGWPNPSLNPGRPKEVEIAKARGTYELITIDDFRKRLDEQNELRRGLGLAPIVDPEKMP